MAQENLGFDAEGHHELERLQHGNFWFRSRNHLLQDLARRWFSNATSILEIGCGTGYVLAGLSEALPNARVAGGEIYTNGLEYAAKRLGSNVDLYQMDAEAIPFSGEFDLIAACDVLEHIEADEHVLKEMYRALKPGGGILVSAPQHPLLWSHVDEIACHKRRYRRTELQEKCQHAGFKVVEQTSFVFTLLPLLVAQRLTAGKRANYNWKVEMTIPYWMDRLLQGALEVERALIARGVSFPLGGSRIVVAMRD